MNKGKKILGLLSGALALTAVVQADQTESGRLWVLSEISYELPSSSSTSFEVGLYGIGGLGGQVNYYPQSHSGLMLSGRVGFYGGGTDFAVLVGYVGDISSSVKWRVGLGLGYTTIKLGLLGSFPAEYPVLDLAIGFKV